MMNYIEKRDKFPIFTTGNEEQFDSFKRKHGMG